MDPLAATPASPDTKKGDKSSTTDDDPPEEIARKRAEIASGSAGLKAAPGGPMAVQPSVGPPSAEADPVVADNRSNTHFNKSLPGPIGDPSGLVRTRATNETATEADSELNLTIPAPPEQSYVSRKECYDSIQKWALENGYAIATARSYPFKGSTRVVYQCDKSSYYRPHQKYVNDTLDDENLDAQPDNTQEAKEHEKDPLGEKKNNPLDAPWPCAHSA
ncbi:hypothetical protein PtB15_8B35 [Puccinia triticina]|nr:hypothetical protein PtB15_8B35 [Puccinia triticina]